MIQLSYSTINNCLQPHNGHNWLNRQMGQKPEDKWFYHEGKEAHDTIQDHVSGKKLHLFLGHIDKRFPIVERVDFDPRTKFEFSFNVFLYDFMTKNPKGLKLPIKLNGEYSLLGFFDGRDEGWTEALEIKSSVTPWSLGKFQKSMQRKLYSLAHDSLKDMYLITGKRKAEEWEQDKPKIFKVPVTRQDKLDAIEWILDAIDLLESGKFDGGLDENGKCTDPWCYFGSSCSFKNG